MKVTGEQSTVLRSLGFSLNVSGQKLLVYHILILIHRDARRYSPRRANLKILNSAPELYEKNRKPDLSKQVAALYKFRQVKTDMMHDEIKIIH